MPDFPAHDGLPIFLIGDAKYHAVVFKRYVLGIVHADLVRVALLMDLSRSDVIRAAIRAGLPVIEQRYDQATTLNDQLIRRPRR